MSEKKTQSKKEVADKLAAEVAAKLDEKLTAKLSGEVSDAIGKEILAKLAKQPLALAAGGIGNVIQSAVAECKGCPNPLAACYSRTFQLAGSKGRKMGA